MTRSVSQLWERRKEKRKAVSFPLRPPPGSHSHHFLLCDHCQHLVTWLCQTAREVGAYSGNKNSWGSVRRLELRELEAAHNISLIDYYYVLETQCSFGVRQCAIFFDHASCRIEPRPLAVKALTPNHWTTREFPIICHFLSVGAWSFLKKKIYFLSFAWSLRWGMWTLSLGMWDLVPWPGFKPMPAALGVQSLNHWTTREVPGTWS